MPKNCIGIPHPRVLVFPRAPRLLKIPQEFPTPGPRVFPRAPLFSLGLSVCPHPWKPGARVCILSGWIILLSSMAERAISSVQNTTAGARVTYDCICEARTCVWVLSCGRDTPSVASERARLVPVSACFTFDSLVCELEYNFFCAPLWRGRNFQSKECFSTQAVLNVQPQSLLEKDGSFRQWTFHLSFLICLFMNIHTLQNVGW